MNQDLGLKILGQIMDWPDERAREEFQWLRLMARLKYDGYRDFQAGMRFIESLATWLQQFTPAERETAYAFVRYTLVYIGPSEMHRLVEQFYPRTVRDRIIRTVAAERGIPTYRVLADADGRAAAERLRRQTLFMGLSDGARIDTVRHANVGLITNEQLVLATQVDRDKWADLLENLRADVGDPEARFRLVYLIDDFTGTGTTFLRYDQKKQKWKGKLIKFRESIESAVTALGGDRILAPGWELCIHHYVASAGAAQAIVQRHQEALPALNGDGWAKQVHASFGTILPQDLPINTDSRHAAFIKLTQTYYDPKIQTKHTEVGGAPHLGLGYGGCALPLVLEHNTPNNSVALLWAETDGGVQENAVVPAMRPLFRRRQRHA
ncbi:phosphoribosyltransferase-like protein [Bradyrhizobium sp. USDA 3650]